MSARHPEARATDSSDAARLERAIRNAFEELAADLGADAGKLLVNVAPIDAEARFEHAEEARIVANAIGSRRREFATGRRLAHALLEGLGAARVPLLPGRNRAPVWPNGVIGSISHARGVVAVVIAPRPPFAAIGLDVEGADPLRTGMLDTVLTADEKLALVRAGHELGASGKLAFAVKECVYKAWSPSLDAIPEFTDVEVDFDSAGASFVARVFPRAAMSAKPPVIRGRCARCDDRVFAVALALHS